MKYSKTILSLAMGCFASSLLFAQAGGDPTMPPTGQPTRTMKTLDQVEPQTPLVNGALGVTVKESGSIIIDRAGSYYLTENLIVTGEDDYALIILSGVSVTLDLNGFSIVNNSGLEMDGISGTLVTSAIIKNGFIIGFENGIRMTNGSRNVTLQNLNFEETSSQDMATAIKLEGCRNFYIVDCLIDGASGSAMSLDNVQNSRISQCLITVNNETNRNGISLSNGSDNNRISDTQIRNRLPGPLSSSRGIDIQDSNNNVVTDCQISDTGDAGVYITALNADATGNVIKNTSIFGSDASGIQLNFGIQILSWGTHNANGNVIEGCNIRSVNFGIELRLNGSSNSGATVRGNLVKENQISDFFRSGIGIYGTYGINGSNMVTQNSVISNHLSTDPSYLARNGINIGDNDSDNLVIKNIVSGAVDNFDISSGNLIGPGASVTATGSLSDTTNPWANFNINENP